ncbi:hypothetical protein [Marinicella litoralis]|uniref:SnoaL-like protein n=1 Tax=Marinicella litoralis TaxID=644220 RepID=A0A4R6XLN6_9GAMM|nr:hypothetical protein [Marinicella litoralis]TDR20542.1 hypothetical protein C8D91_1516 [Marinicella litoralis]
MKKSLLILLGCCVFFLLAACSGDAPVDKETKLLNTINDLEIAIEEKRLDDFLESIDDDFKSAERGWNKKDIERLMRIRLLRNKSIYIHKNVKRADWLDEGEDQVEVEVVAAMAGADISLTDLPTFNGDMIKFTVTFKLIDGEYIITQTEYHRASPADFVF